MDEDSQPIDPTSSIVDLIEEQQEEEFQTHILRENQVNREGGTDATIGDDEPFQGGFDLMLDIVSLYSDVLESNHRVYPAGKVAKET